MFWYGMDDMVLLGVILVVGPFIFFVVSLSQQIMVCVLKTMSCLRKDFLKEDAAAATVNVDIPPTSNVHRYVFDNSIDAADLNEPYLYGDRWMTGLSGMAARIPIQIALSGVRSSTPTSNTVSQIPTQTPVISADISNRRQPTPNISIIGDEDTRSIISGPPPDYNLARRFLEYQKRCQPTPPPSYNECVQ